MTIYNPFKGGIYSTEGLIEISSSKEGNVFLSIAGKDSFPIGAYKKKELAMQVIEMIFMEMRAGSEFFEMPSIAEAEHYRDMGGTHGRRKASGGARHGGS